MWKKKLETPSYHQMPHVPETWLKVTKRAGCTTFVERKSKSSQNQKPTERLRSPAPAYWAVNAKEIANKSFRTKQKGRANGEGNHRGIKLGCKHVDNVLIRFTIYAPSLGVRRGRSPDPGLGIPDPPLRSMPHSGWSNPRKWLSVDGRPLALLGALDWVGIPVAVPSTHHHHYYIPSACCQAPSFRSVCVFASCAA